MPTYLNLLGRSQPKDRMGHGGSSVMVGLDACVAGMGCRPSTGALMLAHVPCCRGREMKRGIEEEGIKYSIARGVCWVFFDVLQSSRLVRKQVSLHTNGVWLCRMPWRIRNRNLLRQMLVDMSAKLLQIARRSQEHLLLHQRKERRRRLEMSQVSQW